MLEGIFTFGAVLASKACPTCACPGCGVPAFVGAASTAPEPVPLCDRHHRRYDELYDFFAPEFDPAFDFAFSPEDIVAIATL